MADKYIIMDGGYGNNQVLKFWGYIDGVAVYEHYKTFQSNTMAIHFLLRGEDGLPTK